MNGTKDGCPATILALCSLLGILLAFIGAHLALKAFIIIGAISNIGSYLIWGLIDTKARKVCRAVLDFILATIFLATVVWLFRIDISLIIIAGVVAFAAAPSLLLHFPLEDRDTP